VIGLMGKDEHAPDEQAPDETVRDETVRDEQASRPGPVETVVVPRHGLWYVDIVVVYPDGVVRRRVGTYRTEQRATVAARLIKRAAERDIPGPVRE
jgi:hypothetical protein